MKIEPFKITDLGYFIPNEWSNPDVVLDQLTDITYEVQTLWGDDGMVQAILCFKNYWHRNWMGFFLIAKDLSKRTPVMLKQHIQKTMDERKALRLQTDSVSNECLKKWHEWLGFKWEGCRIQMLFGQDFDAWAIVRKEA
jgi:hypothetical protein